MPSFALMGLAAAVAAALDAILFNPLTVRRTRAHATQVAPGAPSGWRDTLGLGLAVQLIGLVPRRAWTYAAHHGLMALLLAHFTTCPVTASGLAGLAAGGTEGLAFAPLRRLMATQQAYTAGDPPPLYRLARNIARTEGWRGLWRGCWTNSLRTALGGGAWFAGVALGAAWLPGAGALAHGVAGSLANTLAVNPFEVQLMRRFAPPDQPPLGPPRWLQGLGASLLRTVPSSAVGYWLTQALFRLLSA